MNTFRLIGDLLHAFAIIFLPVGILYHRSYDGISARTQLLLSMVFIARYLDLFTTFISYYNSAFKILFVIVTVSTYLLSYCYKYDRKLDNANSEICVFYAMVMAFVYFYYPDPKETLWAFSEYLEAVAILPQFRMILIEKKINNTMMIYLLCQGLYKLFYGFNWAYRYQAEGLFDSVSTVNGMVFLCLYVIFILLMVFGRIRTKKENEGMLKSNIFFITSNSENMQIDGVPLVNEKGSNQKV